MKLNEIDKDIIDDSFENFLKKLKRDCSDIIRIYNKTNRFLLRGSKNYQDYFIFKPREDRKPRDTNERIHRIINFIFDKAGFEVNRSNGVFCTPDYDTAKIYGNVFVLFPKNNFKFLWSKKISDFSTSFENIFHHDDISDNEKNVFLHSKRKENFKKPYNLYYEYDSFYVIKKEKEQEAIKKLRQIISNHYTKVPVYKINSIRDIKNISISLYDDLFYSFKDETIPEMKKWIEEYAENIENSEYLQKIMISKIKRIYDDKNIVEALYSKNEIIIRSEKIYAVDYNFFKEKSDLILS